MRFAIRRKRRSSVRAAWVVGSALTAGMLATAACLTAPPPDLPALPQHRPTILGVSPRADVPLSAWPDGGAFIVYVQVDPTRTFQWAAFLDFDPANPGNVMQPPSYLSRPTSAPLGATDVGFAFAKPIDDLCHRVDFIVADSFPLDGGVVQVTPSYYVEIHSPTGLGGDIVTWWYTGGNGSCTPYATIDLPDGGFPFPDASSDTPPPVPE